VVTIRDVAREAGVSIATVSRVFNSSDRVSEDARSRVRAASSKLDYWPNVAAQSLTTSRTHALGVLLPDLYGEFFSEVIRGIDQAARREKYQILLSSSHADTHDLLSAARSMRGRVDGLVAMAPDKGSAAAIDQIAKSFPVVLLNPRFQAKGCGMVSIANLDGAYAMVDHLVRLGHSEIAMIKGPKGNVDAEERLRGYRKALRDAGLEPRPALEIQGDFTESSGYQAAAEILQSSPRPTAVFAANDYTAIGLLSALHAAGIDVPQEMAVAGFDDIAISRYVNPPLTTVHVDAFELGQRAIRLWISTLHSASPASRSHEVLPTTLVVRNSCGSTQARAADARERRRRGGEPPASDGSARKQTSGVPLPSQSHRTRTTRTLQRRPEP
jgi:LacI family transcriptional regulator